MDQIGKIFFSKNRNPFRIQFACKHGRIFPAINIRYLGSSECDYIVAFIIPEIGIEVVEIPSGCSNYYYILFWHNSSRYT